MPTWHTDCYVFGSTSGAGRRFHRRKSEMTMRNLFVVYLAVTVATVFGLNETRASVIDQQHLGPVQGNVGVSATLSRGQSFTVGIAGTLAGFEFHNNKSSSRATGNAYLTLYSTDGGGGPDSQLGQVFLPAAAISTTSGFHFFDLSPLNIAVEIGDMLFAALHADFNGGTFATLNSYAGGSEWGCGPAFGIVCWTAADNGVHDLVFRSHVTPLPTPGSLALFGLGLAGFSLYRRRR
jgi:hypothetical protein